jgi:mono/diheme cytochrome c family protein
MTSDDPKMPITPIDPQPTVDYGGVPLWIVLVFGALFYWAQLYLDAHAGGFDKEVYAPYHDIDEVAAANPQGEGDKMITMGRDVYMKTCVVCHQPNGLGKEGQAPPLVGSEWVLAPTADRIVHIPMYGLTGPITVKEQVWNLTMPPLGDNLTDVQIAAVLTYVRTKLGDNHASPVKPELATQARKEGHSGPETSDDLMKIPLP